MLWWVGLKVSVPHSEQTQKKYEPGIRGRILILNPRCFSRRGQEPGFFFSQSQPRSQCPTQREGRGLFSP